jgi:hypothetical protein
MNKINLSVDDQPAERLDIDREDLHDAPAIEGVVHQLARRADGDDPPQAWLEQKAGIGGAGHYFLHVKTARGHHAVLGPVRINAEAFRAAGKTDGYIGNGAKMRMPFTIKVMIST